MYLEFHLTVQKVNHSPFNVPEKHAKGEKLKFNLLLTFINNWLCAELLLVWFCCCWLGGCRRHWHIIFSSSSASSASPLNLSSVKQKPNRVIQFKVTIVQALETKLTVIIFVCRSFDPPAWPVTFAGAEMERRMDKSFDSIPNRFGF